MSWLDFFRKKPAKKVEVVKNTSEAQKAQAERFKAQSRQSGNGLSTPVRSDNYQPDPIDYGYRYWETPSDNSSCHSGSSDSGSSSSSYDSCSSSDSSSSSFD